MAYWHKQIRAKIVLFILTIIWIRTISRNNQRAKIQDTLARLGTSSHDLKIEKGRHHNIQRELRFCENCNQKEIENEYHFLLICPKYMELRQKYLNKYYYTWPMVHKFKCLLSQTAPKLLNNLGKYIYFANKLRTN